MNDERHEELAALNALRMLDADEASAFEIELARDPGLRALEQELEQAAVSLAEVVTPVAPPAHVKDGLMEKVRERAAARRAAGSSAPAARASRGIYLAWSLAAALAVGAFWLWNERAQLSTQVAAMTTVEAEARANLVTVRDERDAAEERNKQLMEQVARLTAELENLKRAETGVKAELARANADLETLRQRDARSQLQIATLQSSVDDYKKGVAVVVWDSEKHYGLLKLEKMPPVQAGKDYQLWVVDPKKPAPVDAGVVKVDSAGFARVDFKPVDAVSEAAKFALSVEKEGGVPKGEGPIVLIGP